jgi:hypothetical protein
MPRRLPSCEAVDIMRRCGLEPLDPYPGTSQPWRCRCLACGREVTPRLDNVRVGSGACRYCTGQAVDPSDAMTQMRLAGFEPLEAYPGAVRP